MVWTILSRVTDQGSAYETNLMPLDNIGIIKYVLKNPVDVQD
jgi:hypothetical protein